MIATVAVSWCPRCAAGVAARQAFWESAPLGQLAVALVPFVVVVLASIAAARCGRDTPSTEDAP